MKSDVFISRAAEETEVLGQNLGKTLPSNTIVAFFGDLGAGKTTFIRGLVSGAGSSHAKEVTSPTFNLLHIYPGNKPVYHFDLYRLPRKEEFFAAGFEEYFSLGGICCIEWAEKMEELLPSTAVKIHFSYLEEGSREIKVVR